MNQAAGMGKFARARTVSKGIFVTYAARDRSMAIRSHVKSGKDLEQDKPAVYIMNIRTGMVLEVLR